MLSPLLATLRANSLTVCTYSRNVCTFSRNVCTYSASVCTYTPSVCTYSASVCTYSPSVCTYTPSGCQRRWFGAGDLKIVAARMKSVKSIQKITKAMKMVAASKLKADQRRLEAGLPFAQPVQNLLSLVPQESNTKGGDMALLCLSSDKGLCGGVNSSVARLARLKIVEAEAGGSVVRIYGVGDKVRGALQRLFVDRFARIFGEVTKTTWSFQTACLVAERLIQARHSRLVVLYNNYKSVIAYDTLAVKMLTEKQAQMADTRELDQFEFEPEAHDMWHDLLSFYYSSTIFGCLLDNIASEQSARMAAMDNASKNAGEMLNTLTLKYNKARQMKITMELIEIISGANAL
eukprot:GHVS01031946.1.p1 GENE.GHVS01031946.1~~GHVS01031946.1.p1  ORF type:complete len:383 (-),score=43.83 GHVS01031946.1:170-1213(-)